MNITVFNNEGYIVNRVLQKEDRDEILASLHKHPEFSKRSFEQGLVIPHPIRLLMVSILEAKPVDAFAAHRMEVMYRGMAKPYTKHIDNYAARMLAHWVSTYYNINYNYLRHQLLCDVITVDDLPKLEKQRLELADMAVVTDTLVDGTKVELTYIGGFVAKIEKR